ncbi:MAG: RecX family transcriptional regulator, partial [Candidatus Omnitrophota bacterium]|nr:RecX family transcriptional regulator [Candidatus Omnitrophota bacterium]
ERSEKEIRGRLKAKGFAGDISAKVIAELTEMGYVDDRRFANMAAENIIKFHPGSLAFIRSALQSKGISGEITEAVISDIKDSYDEHGIAYKLAVNRAGQFSGIEPKKAKQRIYNFLLRRRFSQETIMGVLREIYDL